MKSRWMLALLLLLGAAVFGGITCAGDQKEEKVKLRAAIPFSGVSQKDISLVETEVNKITEEKLGITVEFVATESYTDQITMMLSGEEQLDIMAVMNGQLMESYLNDWLVPLDYYLEKYGQGIVEQVGENVIHCCDINNTLYGIPNNRDYASESNSYMMRKDILGKYHIDPETIKTMEDLEEVFDVVKEGEPDMTILLPGYGTILGNRYYLMGNFRPGAHMDFGRDEDIVNLFETEEYMQDLKTVRRWYLKGYLDENVLGRTESVLKRVEEGNVFAYTTKGKPNILSQDDLPQGPEMVCVSLDEASISYNSIADLAYVITQNTVSPEESMKLLNLFYTDSDIMNLLCYGVEGIHYKKLPDGHITFADEKNRNPFLNHAWSKPNQFISAVWEGTPLDVWEELRRFNETAIQACDVGFNFDISEVETEYAVVAEIYDTYKVLLENGMVNPEEGLTKMLREMREAGIEDILTVERQQFAHWRERNIKVFPS